MLADPASYRLLSPGLGHAKVTGLVLASLLVAVLRAAGLAPLP